MSSLSVGNFTVRTASRDAATGPTQGRDDLRTTMEQADRAEARRAERPRDEEGERDVTPPSPILLATEAGPAGEFELPDPQELRKIESDTQSRLKAILEVAGVTGLSQIDAQTFQDPEILRKLTNRFVNFEPPGAHHVTLTLLVVQGDRAALAQSVFQVF